MKFSAALGVLALIFVAGCNCNSRTHTETRTTTTVSGQTNLLDANDFHLQTVMAMIKENKVDSAESLEKAINGTNGINNVDVDKDGQIDYISVKERREGDAIHLDMMALPSSTKDPKEAVTVASVSFSKNTSTNSVEVRGGYPNYVHGYNDHYYHYRRPGLTFGEAMFLAWMFTPRPIYYHPYGYRTYGYAPRPVYTRSQLSTRRTTYRKQTRVGPVRRVTRPKSYSIGSAKKVPSRFKRQAARGSGFKGRTGSSRKFNTRSGQTNRRSSWGRRSNTRSRSWGNSNNRSRSRSWGNSNNRSRSRSWGRSNNRSRSWGSSGRSRSWGGSRSRSWGGSRSRSFGRRR